VACATPTPVYLPPDVPDPHDVRVSAAKGFRLYVDGGCLNNTEVEGLVSELYKAKAWLLEWLGPKRRPGWFPGRDSPRPACPPDAPPPAVPASIDVVVIRGGDRCHADTDGITITRRHVARRDATHELAHFLCGSGWKPIDEGLAVYLTERIWGPDDGIPVKIRARVFLDLSLDTNLYPDEARKKGMSRRDYDTAGAFVGWLLEAYAREKFFRLYAGPVRDYHTVYGIGEMELWQRFWQYIDNLDVRKNSAYYAFKAKIAH